MACKTNNQVYGIFFRESPLVENKDKELPKEISSSLQQYEDVFLSELPKSLLLERNVNHRIELEPGTYSQNTI